MEITQIVRGKETATCGEDAAWLVEELMTVWPHMPLAELVAEAERRIAAGHESRATVHRKQRQ